jgi:hypothetical protein
MTETKNETPLSTFVPGGIRIEKDVSGGYHIRAVYSIARHVP